jgi:hypothetical protein
MAGKLLKLISFFITFSQLVFSQEPTKTDVNYIKQPIMLGIQIGYSNTYVSDDIGQHNVINVLVQQPITEKMLIRGQIEYYSKSFKYPFYYYDVSVSRSILRDWKDISVNLSLLSRVTRIGIIGGGVSIEVLPIVRDIYTTLPDRSIDWRPQSLSLIRPGIFGLAGLNFKMNDYFTFFIESQYKLIFIGREYGHTVLNSLNTFSGYAGFMVDVK